MAAERYLGEPRRWTAVAAIEAAKALLRLAILRRRGYAMLVDGGAGGGGKEREGAAAASGARQRLRGREPLAAAGKGAVALAALDDFRTRVGPRPSWTGSPPPQRGRRPEVKSVQPAGVAGFEAGRLAQGGGKASHDARGRDPSQPAGCERGDVRSGGSGAGCVSACLVAAELLHILRPVVYVLAIRRLGRASWRPWLLSLAVDLASLALLERAAVTTTAASAPVLPGRLALPGAATSPQKEEVRRRRMLLLLYLFRTPCFDAVARRPLESVERSLKPIPLVGLLAERAMELLLGVQQFYFYTSGS
eukprot:SM000128S26218  [mRNA]  locus=s128:106389:108151:- [translate_table: standard]